MVNYEKIFEPYYEGGWEAYPLETTLVTAGALNAYDAAIMHIEDYLDTQVDPNDNLAETYDETATYEAGEYRIYNGVLYKCLEDIDEAEEFDPTKWQACLVTDEMATSGGTTVIANPVGTPTDDLETIQIGETIYDIPGGGGGNANIWTGTQAELEEVFDELEEGTQINITDDEQEVVDGGTIYSEDEQVIGLWTDKKPLYQKTFHLTSVTLNQGSNTVISTSQLSSLSIDKVIGDVSGSLTFNSGANVIDIPYAIGATSYITAYYDNSTGIVMLRGGNALSTNDIYLTFKYTKSTDAPLDAVVGKKTMYIASSDCYSTEEKEVGCWTDGKPLYQKTIDFGALPNNASKSVAHGIANIEEVVDYECLAYSTSNGYHLAIPYVNKTNPNLYNIQFDIDATNINIATSADRTSYNICRVTLKYTKTTDTAGSGSYTPASGKAVHYSTNEQVVGTWINGEPVYEICATTSIPATNVWSSAVLTNLNINILIDATLISNFNTNSDIIVNANDIQSINGGIRVQGTARAVDGVILRYTKATS